MNKYVIVAGIAALLGAGCSGDKGAPAPATGEQATAGAAAPAMEAAPPVAESALGSGVIDHTRDAKEFELRRSLWGVESMIELYQQNGHDTADLQAQRSKLIADLKALLQ